MENYRQKAYRRISENTALNMWLTGDYVIYMFPACYNDYRVWDKKFSACPIQGSNRPLQSLKNWFSANAEKERITLKELKLGKLAFYAVPRLQE